MVCLGIDRLDACERRGIDGLSESSIYHDTYICTRAGGLGEAVDVLLDKGKRIGIWAPRKTLHMALHKCVRSLVGRWVVGRGVVCWFGWPA